MLFKSADPAIRVSLDVVISMAVFTSIVVAFLVTMVLRTHRTQVTTGAEGLVNKRGVARTEIAPRGKVFVHGEIWDAVADNPIPVGAPIDVVAVEGMVLRVRQETEV
jgi:membrane-bound serine protease (ClpP class)